MAIPALDLANLLSLQKPAVAAFWEVIWDPLDVNETRYYSDKCYGELPPFQAIGLDIKPKMIGSVVKDTTFEISPDIKTEKINVTFDNIIQKDIEGVEIDPLENIQARFQLFKSGIRCELFFYWPNPGADPITESQWVGTLQAPEIYGYKTVRTTATNGYRSREQKVPRRQRPRECTANFGAWMPSTFELESNGCPYDRHLGGSLGNLNPVTGLPYLDCPRDSVTTCNTRLGTTDGKYFLGFNTAGGVVISNPTRGEIYISKGNTSALKEPIRVVAGEKYVRGLPIIAFRRERNANTPVQSAMSALVEVAEGPNESISGFKVKDAAISSIHHSIRDGSLGQGSTNYSPGISNFSGTAHVNARYHYIDLTEPTNAGPGDFTAECLVKGYKKVAVFTDVSTYTRIWTNNRVWWLLELMTNQRFGLAYPKSKFELADWIDRADWAEEFVKFTATFLDGEEISYQGQRTKFEAILEGRAVAEQIEDICRTGSISVPFQHDGKFTIASFEAITDEQYDALRTFTDTGDNRNILWGDGQPNISLSQTPDDKVVNELEVTFEENSNTDIARPVKVDDPNQKLKAGRALGENNLHPVPKQYSAFGARSAQEAIRLAHRLLRFGDSDEGGTQNNLRATFTTPFEQTLGLKRYGFIRIESSLLDGFEIGTGDWVAAPEIFRILRMKKISNGLVEMTCQVYNDAAYLEMDILDPLGEGDNAPPFITIAGAGSEEVNVTLPYTGDLNGKAYYTNGPVVVKWSGTQWEIRYNGSLYYDSLDAVPYPSDVTTWNFLNGFLPEPVVFAGTPTFPGELATISNLAYSAGVLTLDIG